MNRNLYIQSQRLINLDFPRVRLMDTSADGYIYDMITNRFCDIAINIDEDAFLVDEKALMSLLDYMIDNDYIACGMSDGNDLPIRQLNPIVINPFFNIINTKRVREKFNLKEIKSFSYFRYKDSLINKLPQRLKIDTQSFECADFEPYYPFFFWLAYNFKILYLPVEEHSDGITTILKNQEGKTVLLHTWYSRFYGIDKFHTERIDNIIKEAFGTSYYGLIDADYTLYSRKYGIEKFHTDRIDYIKQETFGTSYYASYYGLTGAEKILYRVEINKKKIRKKLGKIKRFVRNIPNYVQCYTTK